MTELEQVKKDCIKWGQERGIFEGELINQWRVQCGKMREELIELRIASDIGSVEKASEELGDCLFVLNNLNHIALKGGKMNAAECVRYNDGWFLGINNDLRSEKGQNRFEDCVFVYKHFLQRAFLYFGFYDDDGKAISSNEQISRFELRLLKQTLEKNSNRDGKNVGGNWIKSEDLK